MKIKITSNPYEQKIIYSKYDEQSGEYNQITVKDMKLKEDILIVSILRGKNVIFPSGNEEIKPKDTIVIIDGLNQVKEINDILE